MTGDEIGDTIMLAIDNLIAANPAATRGQIFRAMGQGLLNSGFTSGFDWFWGETSVDASAARATIDFSLHRNISVLVSVVNTEFIFATAPLYTTHVQVRIVQCTTGGMNVIFPSGIKWAAGLSPGLIMAPDTISFVSFFYAAGVYYGMYGTDFS